MVFVDAEYESWYIWPTCGAGGDMGWWDEVGAREGDCVFNVSAIHGGIMNKNAQQLIKQLKTADELVRLLGGVGEIEAYEYYGAGTVQLGCMAKTRAYKIYRCLVKLQKQERKRNPKKYRQYESED